MSGDYDGSLDDKGFHHGLFSGDRPNWLRVIRALSTLNESMAGNYFVPLELATRCTKLYTWYYVTRDSILYAGGWRFTLIPPFLSNSDRPKFGPLLTRNSIATGPYGLVLTETVVQI
jgi:hypothetical protein